MSRRPGQRKPGSEVAQVTKVSAREHQKEPPVFEYPDIPRWEYTLYIGFIFCMLLYAWYLVYDLTESSGIMIRTIVRRPMFWGYGPVRHKDMADFEWEHFSLLLRYFVPALILHSLLYNGLDSVLKQEMKDHVLFGYSFGASMVVFGVDAVAAALGLAVLMFTVAHYSRNKLIIWLVACPTIVACVQWAIPNVSNPYLFLTIGMYNMCKYISYGCEMTDLNLRESDRNIWQRFYRMLQYSFYQPYIVFIIVNYNDWEHQVTNRMKVPRQWAKDLLFCARVAFWFVVVDCALYYCHMTTLISVMQVVTKVRHDQLCALGYCLGQFFHMKYVVIFGVGCAFARLDRLTPYAPSMCIARVALYSKIWRAFDRGLYAFFKRYIFTPICAPHYTTIRKTGAMLLVFGFVLVWHGFHHHNLVWVALNIWELAQEVLSKVIYSKTPLRRWREAHISDGVWRRILAWLQVCPYTHALVSIFYFLGGSEVGWIFVSKIIIAELLPMNYPAVVLITIGYIYCQSCMQIELWQSRAAARLKQD